MENHRVEREVDEVGALKKGREKRIKMRRGGVKGVFVVIERFKKFDGVEGKFLKGGGKRGKNGRKNVHVLKNNPGKGERRERMTVKKGEKSPPMICHLNIFFQRKRIHMKFKRKKMFSIHIYKLSKTCGG